MKIGYKNAMICAIGFLFSIFMPAQEIPKLPTDDSVAQGVLPNGMKYFIVENPTQKGLADFALVNRVGHKILHKPDVWISFSESVMDSTLLNLMNISGGASPSDHAVIVAGDVKTESVKEKIKMLSYMTPVRDTLPRSPYAWKAEEELKVRNEICPDRNLTELTATWRAPRTSEELMNTIQPTISSLFAGQLGIIAKERLEMSFRSAGIPVTGVSHFFSDSTMSPDDETFSITLSVAPENLEQAVRILSSVMAGLDAGNVTLQEINRTHDIYLEELYAGSAHPVRSNAEYIERCASAFFYNGALASTAQVYAFHSSRYLPDETELTLFSNIASAALDKESNLTIKIVSPQNIDSERVADVFKASWDQAGPAGIWGNKVEADAFFKASEPEKKMKMSMSKKDPMSGGSAFTLDNGLNVVCRKQSADKRIYFSLSLDGGYGNVKGLSSGEGAYFSDFLYTCRVADIPMKDFLDALEARGVRMGFEVGMSSMSISGSASRYELLTVIQALAMLTGSIGMDEAELDYYLKTVPLQLEALKGTRQARMAAIGGILYPDNIWSDMKSELPGKDFGQKAWRFYESQFAKLDNGVLVIAGDVDETELRKHLAVHGHLFRTQNRSVQRPDIRYQPVSGVSTYTVKGAEDVIDYAMSARCPFTSDNHVSATAASMAVRQRLSEVFDGSGWTVDVRHEFAVQPDERFNMVVTLVRMEDGLSHSEALSLLRATVVEMASKPLKKNQIDAFSVYLKNRMSLICTDASFWTEAITGRRLFGKDIITGYSAKCDALTAQKVQNIIASLEESGKVEYITKK